MSPSSERSMSTSVKGADELGIRRRRRASGVVTGDIIPAEPSLLSNDNSQRPTGNEEQECRDRHGKSYKYDGKMYGQSGVVVVQSSGATFLLGSETKELISKETTTTTTILLLLVLLRHILDG